MRSKKSAIITNSLILFFFISPLSLLAQEKFLKLNNIIKYDSSVTFVPPNVNNLFSNKIYFTVPTGKYWKIQSIHSMTLANAGNFSIDLNNNLILGGYGYTGSNIFGSFWCLPGDVIAIYAQGTPGYTGKFNYRMLIWEFLLEQ